MIHENIYTALDYLSKHNDSKYTNVEIENVKSKILLVLPLNQYDEEIMNLAWVKFNKKDQER